MAQTCGSWKELNTSDKTLLSDETIATLNKIGFPGMMPVQKSVASYLLNNKDVAVEAITGSGKTLAYLVPAVEFIKKAKTGLTVLVLVPTRELAKQVYDVATKLSQYIPEFVPQFMIGGSKVDEDIETFKNTDPTIIIATPGKLHEFMDIMTRSAFTKIECFIIDEADQILQNGSGQHLSQIFQKLPRQRRTGLFSATMTSALQEIILTGMRNPTFIRIRSNEGQTPAELVNFYAIVDPKMKYTQLLHFLRTTCSGSKVIVFVMNRFEVDYMQATMKIILGDDIHIFAMHGKMAQKDRQAALDGFREQPNAILLATDVAARGIDIPEIEWIIQFDAPQNPEMFVHRIGRTARIGNSGNAIILLREHEDAYVDFTESEVGIKMVEMSLAIPEDGEEMLDKVRHAVAASEDMYMLSMKTVVGYTRAYSEHKLKLLLRLKELDLVDLAASFGLICVPKMPELRTKASYPPRVQEYNEKYQDLAEPYVKKNFKIEDFGGTSKLKGKPQQGKVTKNDKKKEKVTKNDTRPPMKYHDRNKHKSNAFVRSYKK